MQYPRHHTGGAKKVVIFVNLSKLYLILTDWQQSPFSHTCKNQVLELPELQEPIVENPSRWKIKKPSPKGPKEPTIGPTKLIAPKLENHV